jgi:alpha-beta hydrolase superfamily lysophospholipase
MDPRQGRVPARSLDVHLERRLTLPGRLWLAPEPRALVALCHGLGEHSGRYGALASDLAEAGYSVASMDLPGHGEAPGPRGDIPSWALVRDHGLPALFTALHDLPGQPRGLPRILFGHSMGGLVALDFAVHHAREIAGVAASAPGLRAALPPWWKLALANVARITTPAAGFPHGLPDAGMSRDPEVLRLRKEDPLMHDRISPRLYFQLTEAQQRVMREARRLAVPALVMHGEADTVTDPEGSREFVAAAPGALARLVTYPGSYHEIFNDLDRARVVRDLLAWMKAIVG